jgi:hypothetical protein
LECDPRLDRRSFHGQQIRGWNFLRDLLVGVGSPQELFTRFRGGIVAEDYAVPLIPALRGRRGSDPFYWRDLRDLM